MGPDKKFPDTVREIFSENFFPDFSRNFTKRMGKIPATKN
jgi:hypothetical protein